MTPSRGASAAGSAPPGCLARLDEAEAYPPDRGRMSALRMQNPRDRPDVLGRLLLGLNLIRLDAADRTPPVVEFLVRVPHLVAHEIRDLALPIECVGGCFRNADEFHLSANM